MATPLRKPSPQPCPPPGDRPHAEPIALPAHPPHYVVPGSHKLDPPYSWNTPWWPFPRPPWPFETESRAAGTGLIWGSRLARPPKPQPCPPNPCPPNVTQFRRRAR